MSHANFTVLCVIEVELLPIEVSHCENRDFDVFAPITLNLDQITFIYELDLYSLETHRMSENEFRTSRLSKVIVRQIDRHDRNYRYHSASIVVGQ